MREGDGPSSPHSLIAEWGRRSDAWTGVEQDRIASTYAGSVLEPMRGDLSVAMVVP